MKIFQNIILPIVILVTCLILANIIMKSSPKVKKRKSEKPILNITAKNIKKQNYSIKIQAWGQVYPQTQTNLTSEVSGIVKKISPNIRPGKFFKKGDMLFELDSQKYRMAVIEQESNLSGARLKLVEEEARVKQSGDDIKNFGNNIKTSSLTQRIPQLDFAQKNVQAVEAKLKDAKKDLEKTIIRAPYDGRCKLLNVDVGQYVGMNSVLGSIITTDSVKIKVPLSDKQMNYLEMTDISKNELSIKSMIKIKDDYANETWQGFLTGIETEVNPISKYYTGIIIVDNPYYINGKSTAKPLQPGIFVEAEIEGETLKDVYVIPESSILDGNKIYIVNESDDKGTRNKDSGKEYSLELKLVDVLWYDGDNVIIKGDIEDGALFSLTRINFSSSGSKLNIKIESQK